jgi:transcriptional regulator with XRE-family HTH domain
MKMPFPELLEQKFLEWQMEKGERKTLYEFANYLGVSHGTISFWINGVKKPSDSNIEKLAELFGNEIYDALDLPRPNPYLQKLNRLWQFIPEEIQKKFSDEADKYETQNTIDRVPKTSKRRKTSKPE